MAVVRNRQARSRLQRIAAALWLFVLSTQVAAGVTRDAQLIDLPATAVERAVLTFSAQPDEQTIQSLESAGLIVTNPFQLLPMLVVQGHVAALLDLDDIPGLRSIYLDRPQELLLDLTVPKVTGDGAAYAEDCGGLACDGQGIAVAVIDTGVDGTHPDLCLDGRALTPPMASDALCPGQEPAMVQNVEVLTDDPANPVIVEGVMNTDETGGHGTHVASIVAGRGIASARFAGTAPGAKLVGVSAGDAVTVLNTTLAIEWVILNKDRFNIRVINNSWGSTGGAPYDPGHPVIVASTAASEAGLVVVFSAGNSGPGTDSMNMYSQNPDVLSVAASANREATAEDIAQGVLIPRDPIEEPAVFSAVGIPGSDIAHPDIMAPGQFVIAARATTGFAGASDTATDPVFMQDPNELQYYTTHSGTSMAAPHVSGVAAMVWQAALSTGAQPSAETIREILLNTASPFQDGTLRTVWQEYRAGRGYLDGLAAVREALTRIAQYSDGVNDLIDPGVATDVQTFGGGIGEGLAGGSCPATLGPPDPLVPRHAFEVFTGALTMDVMLDWTLAANDLELCLYDPAGMLTSSRRVESDVVQAPVDREHLATPAVGRWTVEVRGTAALEAYDGYASVLYPQAQSPNQTLALAPVSAEREIGQTHAVTATITDVDGPVAGVAVDWTLDGVGSLISADEVTDRDGRATLLLTSTEPGQSVITARYGNVEGQATVAWTERAGEDKLPGRSWGAGELYDGERLNLNVRRDRIDGPVTGHLKFDGSGIFRATNFLQLEIDGSAATLVAEGSWNNEAGYTAIVTVDDLGNPGADADGFSMEVRTGNAEGPVLTSASGVIRSGNLGVAERR